MNTINSVNEHDQREQSKAVACTCADHVAGETGYVTFSTPVPFGTKLALQSALHAAEAERDEWRRIADSTREWGRTHLDRADKAEAEIKQAKMISDNRFLLVTIVEKKLRAAEAELGELRRKVGELSADMRDAVKSVCETGGYINSDDVVAWESELKLLASDGGADGETT